MAMVNCKECKKEISNKAAACPHCGAKNPGTRVRDVLAGLVVVIIGAWILSQCVGGESKTKDPAEAKAAASAPATAQAEKPLPESSRPTIGRSTATILGDLPTAERTSNPLKDGTLRESIKLTKYLHLETIGNKADLLRYSLMFGLPSDDKVGSVETGLTAAVVLANTFPSWGKKEGDNAMTWIGDATKKLSSNIKRNKDEPEPVVMERDGLRVNYSAVPSLGIFFITVEPMEKI